MLMLVVMGWLLQTGGTGGLLPDFDWSADVEPQIQSLLSNGLITGALVSVAALAVAVLGARAVIGIFFTRH